MTECHIAAQRFTIPAAVELNRHTAGCFVRIARKFKASITVKFCDKTANRKRVKDLSKLGARCGALISIMAQGYDAFEALQAIENLFSSGFKGGNGVV